MSNKLSLSIMVPWRLLSKRSFSTETKNDIGQIFIQNNVQKLLTEITRFEERKIFSRRPVSKLRSPKLMFMTDQQLDHAKKNAYDHVKARLQMPPVMTANTSQPEVLSCDEDIVGYTKFKIMFIDISPGYSNRQRLMSVREPSGTLRYPTYEERSRLNHIFYPDESISIDPPKMFQEENMTRLLKQKEYIYILSRACLQFEPDDPRYVEAATRVYNHIDDKGDFKILRSTRHFGPMSLYLAYNKRADNLILEMLSNGMFEDAAKLVKVYHTCHNINYDGSEDYLALLRDYTDNHSGKKYNLDLALQDLENKKKLEIMPLDETPKKKSDI